MHLKAFCVLFVYLKHPSIDLVVDRREWFRPREVAQAGLSASSGRKGSRRHLCALQVLMTETQPLGVGNSLSFASTFDLEFIISKGDSG